jgi:ethanolamine utilization protein EutN
MKVAHTLRILRAFTRAQAAFPSRRGFGYNQAPGSRPASVKTMQLARVIGTVVSTVKNPTLGGRKLLVIESLDAELRRAGRPLVAVDSIGAGIGELVFWCRGKEASFPFEGSDVPTDCTIVAIVDSPEHVKNIYRTS